MIKHIVLWKLIPEKKPEAEQIAANLNAKFKALLGKVDGLAEIEAARNYNGGDYDIVLNCTFSTREAERAYQTHPGHVAIKSEVHALVFGRECVDYDVPEK